MRQSIISDGRYCQTNTMGTVTDFWIERLDYDRDDAALFRSTETVGAHPYAFELHSLLDGTVDPAIQAVVCVDHVPSVCFVEIEPDSQDDLGACRT